MRVMVGMSGGVDSSVAAALLMEQGHEIVGVTLKLWGGESDSGCCSVADVDDARRVADGLGIEHHVFNFGDDFDEKVVEPYIADHAAGRTPNPCIECNRHIKFDRLLWRADALGFDAVATGHHARIVERPDGTHRIARGADADKDQSYVLHMLDQEALARTLLPVGELTKSVVRERAAALGFATATKPDSQDVCFITRTDGRRAFVGARIDLTPARVVDTDGRTVGELPAIEMVTLGQRKGLGLGGGSDPRYVVDVDRAATTVVVGSKADLLTTRIDFESPTWADAAPADDSAERAVLVQTSAHGSVTPGRVVGSAVDLDAPIRRVAPGQSLVFYDEDEVLGGAIVSSGRDGQAA